MKTKYSLLLLGLLLAIPKIYGQLDSFDLAKYKLPDIKRKQLDLNLSSSMRNNLTWPDTYASFNASGMVSVQYSSYTNLPSFQGSGSIQVNLNPSTSSYHTFTASMPYKNKGSSFSEAVSINKTNRFYISGLSFLEADLTAHASQENSRAITRYITSTDSLLERFDNDGARAAMDVTLPLLAGIGRIEPVEDARLAIYILDDLKKAGRLSREPSEAEILEFSSVISSIKNKRFFDARIRKIEELKAVDQYLKTHGLVNESDIVYFSSVNDNWDYSSGPARSAGGRFYAGIQPGFSRSTNLSHQLERDGAMNVVYKYKDHSSENQWVMEGIAGYNWCRPINLYWQLDAGASLSYAYGWIKSIFAANTENLSHQPVFSSREYMSLGYYPNSRTYASASLNLAQSLERPESFSDFAGRWLDGPERNLYTASLNLSMYYYFSPQLRLSGSWDISAGLEHLNSSGTETRNKKLDQYLSLGFVYSIF